MNKHDDVIERLRIVNNNKKRLWVFTLKHCKINKSTINYSVNEVRKLMIVEGLNQMN